MSAIPRRPPRVVLPWGLLGMVGLVAIVEPSLACRDLDVTAYIPSDWKVAGRAVRRDVARRGVLCFGDSEVKHGIVPAVIEQCLGRPAYNLAVIGGQAPSSYFLLRRALDSAARPSALILNSYPGLLATDPRNNERQWPELLTTSPASDLAWTNCAMRTSSPGRCWRRCLPSVRARLEVRAACLAALRGEPSLARREGLAYRRNWRLNRGAQVAPRNPGFGDDPGPAAAAPSHRWKCKPANAAYLRRFLALAASRDIPVFWLMPTLSPAWQTRASRAVSSPPMRRSCGRSRRSSRTSS